MDGVFKIGHAKTPFAGEGRAPGVGGGTLHKLNIKTNRRSAGDPFSLAHFIRQGKRLLLLAETPMQLYPYFPHWQNVKVEERAGTPWQGDWASAFSWLHRGEAFAAVPGKELLDLTFDRVIPRHIISGCNQHDFHRRVHAGIFVGWLHKSAALVVERPYGKGHLVASTFQLLRDPPGHDSIATQLLDGLIELTALSGTRLAKSSTSDPRLENLLTAFEAGDIGNVLIPSPF